MENQKYKTAILMKKEMAKAILHPEDLEFLSSFSSFNNIEELPQTVNESFMKKAIKDADVCITSWGTPGLTSEMLGKASTLKLIAHAAGTVKSIVPDYAWEREIKVTGAAPVMAKDVAETTIGLIILSLKRMVKLNSLTHKGLWKGDKGELDCEVEKIKRLYRLKIGVVGASHVGRNVIAFLKPFNISVLLYDPCVSESQAREMGVIKVSLDELMSSSDVVTLHAPNLPQTRGMINKDNLKLMKDGAILINTARGVLVDTQALYLELKTGRISACLDEVYVPESLGKNPLFGLENVILTPCIAGGVAKNGRYEIGSFVIQQIYKCLNGEEMEYEVKRDMLSTIA